MASFDVKGQPYLTIDLPATLQCRAVRKVSEALGISRGVLRSLNPDVFFRELQPGFVLNIPCLQPP